MTALASASGGLAAAPVSGVVTDYRLANGIVEQCIRVADLPGAQYSEQDRQIESSYCELDFRKIALCPKLWSTSPGTILYEIDLAAYGGEPERFERQHCDEGFHVIDAAESRPGAFKISVNARDTSATYAPASWVYYHFARYFRTNTHVPVAVYRSMDAQAHLQRVTKPALEIVAGRKHLGMLTAGWRFLDAVESGQEGGASAAAALTDNGRQVFGVVLNAEGDRYGAEFNGTRESGWGAGQNLDFQQTAPFLALRDARPVPEAAADSIREARKNPRMAKDLPADTQPVQVVFWMQDVTEITLLDFLLGQQDRIGNIDYNWRWYWVADGRVEWRPAQGKDLPPDLADLRPTRLRQSAINDNDAGVRAGYADFAQKTHMLEGLRHYSADLYQRLGLLAADYADQGPAWTWLSASAGLSAREAETIGGRVYQAFELLRSDCESGSLKLDLEPAMLLPGWSGDAQSAPSCSISTP